MFLLALIPIAVILILMVVFRWGAARAGGAGYLSALAVAVIFFGAGTELLAYTHVKALLLTFDVLLIIWAAFLLYRVADEAGAIQTIGKALPHLTALRGMQALIIGWVFASFLQGVGGFGVPVAVIAPIMVGLGFTPMAAVIVPSIGHSWAVTFGSLGSSFQALLAATGLPEELLGPPSALFLGIAAIFVGPMIALITGGWKSLRNLLVPALIIGFVMAVVQYIAVVSGIWNIGAFLGGLAGLVISIPLARRYRGKNSNNEKINMRTLLIALSGYAGMVAITLIIQLILPVREALGSFVIEVNFPEMQTSLGYVTPAGPGRTIPLFRHAGAILAYSSIAAFLIYQLSGLYQPGAVSRILNSTLRKVMSSSVGIASMVAMANIMQHSGMTDTLANGLANGMGRLFPLAAPWIGALGAFMTGSNTNSNVLFGALQMRTAELLGFSVAIILAAQTAGAAIGSIFAPTKVVVGASTAGMEGKEGDIMRKLIIYSGILILLISILSMIGVYIAGGSS